MSFLSYSEDFENDDYEEVGNGSDDVFGVDDMKYPPGTGDTFRPSTYDSTFTTGQRDYEDVNDEDGDEEDSVNLVEELNSPKRSMLPDSLNSKKTVPPTNANLFPVSYASASPNQFNFMEEALDPSYDMEGFEDFLCDDNLVEDPQEKEDVFNVYPTGDASVDPSSLNQSVKILKLKKKKKKKVKPVEPTDGTNEVVGVEAVPVRKVRKVKKVVKSSVEEDFNRVNALKREQPRPPSQQVAPAVIPPRKTPAAQAVYYNVQLLKELDLAMKRVAVYSQENEKLKQRIDVSGIDSEFAHMKNVILNQDIKIAKLEEDNRALLSVNRYQEKKLLALQQQADNRDLVAVNRSVIGGETSVTNDSRDVQLHILLHRVRRVQTQLSESRAREKTSSKQVTSLKREVDQLKSVNATLSNSLREALTKYASNHSSLVLPEASISLDDKNSSEIMHNETTALASAIAHHHQTHHATSGFGEGSVGGGNSLVRGGDSLASGYTGGSNAHAIGNISTSSAPLTIETCINQIQEGMSAATIIYKLQNDCVKLRNIVERQRVAHAKQISTMRSALLHAQDAKMKIQQDFSQQERQIKHQISVVKQLKQTCEELAEANKRLMLASDFFTSKGQPNQVVYPAPTVVPQPPVNKPTSAKNPVRMAATKEISKPKAAVLLTDDENA